MDKMKKLHIGFLGLGVVGAQLMNIIRENEKKLKEQYGTQIIFGKVLVRDLNKKRETDVTNIELTTNGDEIVCDEKIDVVIDCMGGAGCQQTTELLYKAICNGKNVIMSSKKCLALNGKKFVRMANENKIYLGFDATVGGGIPITHMMKSCGLGEKITNILGIFNATSNFILSKMQRERMEFEAGLAIAQNDGYAENDPSEDINGYDALYKLVIMMGMCFDIWKNPSELLCQSIMNIKYFDFKYLSKYDSCIKAVAMADRVEHRYYIGPCVLKKDTLIANVNDNNNLIFIDGTWSGRRAFYGQGAGNRPTCEYNV